MATKVRLISALCALVMAVVVAFQSAPRNIGHSGTAVELRSTDAPMSTVPSLVLPTTNPRPFEPCEDIPLDAVQGIGLAFTPPTPEEGLRCRYDAGNYSVAVEAIIWRTYAETLPNDAVETTINGHRAAQYWIMKPSDWNDRWWASCMVVFKTSYGLIQQSLFYSTIESNPPPNCLADNMRRAHELSPHYIF